ncbi:MAG: glycosyltransferase family 4 protein [Chloroflexota bacterium]
MRLLFVADGRSPITQNWIRHFVERGDEVHLVSTFHWTLDFPVSGLTVLPVAFSGMKKPTGAPAPSSARTLGLRTVIRQWLGPLTIPRAARSLRILLERIQPDLVHALRIPYEGMLAAEAYAGTPLVVSVWGNDFTLHAPSTPLMHHYTQWTLKVADALHADCRRDIRLGGQFGFDMDRPTLVTPGNGGIRTEVFHPPQLPAPDPIVVNPRGFRAYVHNEAFFRSIPLVLEKHPNARFVCSSMAGESQAMQWIEELGIQHAVTLNPPMPHVRMAEVFRAAQVVVSPSFHDGTPNSLLEGMACGCFPVAGDLESIREWITHGKNGLLVDSSSPRAIADGILSALESKNLREQAAGLNAEIIAARADYQNCMAQVEAFYQKVIGAQ